VKAAGCTTVLRSPKANRRIEIVHAQAAGFAVRIRYTRFHTNPITGFQIGDSLPNLQDYPGCLVTQYKRLPDHKRTNCPVLEVVYVAPADPDSLQLDQYILLSQLLGDFDVSNGKMFGFF
jgi:hypothetical protein